MVLRTFRIFLFFVAANITFTPFTLLAESATYENSSSSSSGSNTGLGSALESPQLICDLVKAGIMEPSSGELLLNQDISSDCSAGDGECGMKDGVCNATGSCTSGACTSDPAKTWECHTTRGKACKDICKDVPPPFDKGCEEICGRAINWSASIDEICGCLTPDQIKKRNDQKTKNSKSCNDKNGKRNKYCFGGRVGRTCIGYEVDLGTWECTC